MPSSEGPFYVVESSDGVPAETGATGVAGYRH